MSFADVAAQSLGFLKLPRTVRTVVVLASALVFVDDIFLLRLSLDLLRC